MANFNGKKLRELYKTLKKNEMIEYNPKDYPWTKYKLTGCIRSALNHPDVSPRPMVRQLKNGNIAVAHSRRCKVVFSIR